jgi:hypothetical protein
VIFKVRVKKVGSVDNYVGLPILDRVYNDDDFIQGTMPKVVGVVTNAVEVEDRYELWVALRKEFSLELVDGEPSSLSFDL